MKYSNKYKALFCAVFCTLLNTISQQAGISYELSRPHAIAAQRYRIAERTANSIIIKENAHSYLELKYNNRTRSFIGRNWDHPVNIPNNDERLDDILEQLYPSAYIYLIATPEADAIWLNKQFHHDNMQRLKTNSSESKKSTDILLSSESKYSKSSNAEETSDTESSRAPVPLRRQRAMIVKKRSRSGIDIIRSNSTTEPKTQPKYIESSLASTVIVELDADQEDN